MLIPTTLLHCLSTRVPIPHTLIWQGAGDCLRGELSSHVHAVSSWSVLWGPVPTLRVLRAVLLAVPVFWVRRAVILFYLAVRWQF